jgi:DNA-binding GntR family transcriptional regulator
MLLKVDPLSAPVRQQVVKALREGIVSGALAPGQRLVEKELCGMLGVSRPPIREALRELEAEGLVRNVPYKGAEVTRLDVQEAESIYQVRGALEALATKLFALRATDEERARLRLAFEHVKLAYETGDVEAILVAKADFYEIVMTGSKNQTIPAILRAMNARITLFRRYTLSRRDRLPASIRELRQIVTAIERRDEEAAFRSALKHVDAAAKVALASIGKNAANRKGDRNGQRAAR